MDKPYRLQIVWVVYEPLCLIPTCQPTIRSETYNYINYLQDNYSPSLCIFLAIIYMGLGIELPRYDYHHETIKYLNFSWLVCVLSLRSTSLALIPVIIRSWLVPAMFVQNTCADLVLHKQLKHTLNLRTSAVPTFRHLNALSSYISYIRQHVHRSNM